MTQNTTIRTRRATGRVQTREAKNRQRELDRQIKEAEKLTTLEQSRLEVEAYENSLDVLLSLHKEQTDAIDWLAIAVALPPIHPCRQKYNELKARQSLALLPTAKNKDVAIELAKQQDERDYEESLQSYAADYAEWSNMASLARRILNSDQDAYIEAVEKINPFSELDGIGSSFHFTSHNPRLVEVMLSTHGRQAIPAEQKLLTASGKVSVKAIPKSRFAEIYQDYICSCVLRAARELFALLPIETLLISSSAETLDTTTGQTVERPFLSVVISRNIINSINFNMIDPSDSIMSMPHRGDLRTSRKTGDFELITPLTVADLTPQDAFVNRDFNATLETAQRLRAELTTQCAALNPELT